MTDTMTMALKCLLFLAAAGGCFLLCKNTACRAWLCLSAVIFALAANAASGQVHGPTDTLMMTALGEKNEASVADEVALYGILVGGTEYSCGQDLGIGEGKWFWCGESYMWRNEADPRQPEGLTRTVTLEIPVGEERRLIFHTNMYSGLVDVTAGGETQTVDTYSEAVGVIQVPISDSSRKMLLLDACEQLAIYVAVLFGLTAGALGLARYYLRRPGRLRRWAGSNAGKLIFALMAAAVGALMFSHGSDESFWVDDLIQVFTSSGGLKTAFDSCRNMLDATPPLFSLAALAWYRLAPYGEKWLLLLDIIPTALSVYVLGLLGEKRGGLRGGVLAAAFIAFSLTVWERVAFEYRAYAFMLLFSSLSLYTYYRKEREDAGKWRAAFSLSLACLAMSHYFGILLCVVFFLADAVGAYKSWQVERKINAVLAAACLYILPGALSAAWVAVVMISTNGLTTNYMPAWYPIPTLSEIRNAVLYLCGNVPFLCLMALFEGGYILTELFSPKKEKNGEKDWAFSRLLLGAVAGVFALLFVYGRYINRQNTMFENRYFTELIPFFALLFSAAVCRVLDLLPEDRAKFKNAAVLCISAALAANCLAGASSFRSNQPFREAADWLYTQVNYIFDPGTVAMTTGTVIPDSWNEYYIGRCGRRDELNVTNQYKFMGIGEFVGMEETAKNYERIYIAEMNEPILPVTQEYLDQYYDLEQYLPELQMKVYVRKAV